eukprot:Seg1354.14 transcript_id=Seg1354.14/GoldUCD/mRNA.D3Y31 product="DNA repair protein XRCC4" protein_id=Seg1354.14/GoldUCD/D3Y31
MEETFLKIQSSGRIYYLMIKCPSDGDVALDVTLVNGAEVWCGDVSNEELKQQAEAVEKEFHDFWSETKAALALENSVRPENFCHEVDIQNDLARVSWKQVLDHGIKFQLGSAKLYKKEDTNINSFLDAAIGKFSNMKAKVSSFSTENRKLLNERERTLKRLEECTKAKEGIEKDLYQKFTAVLNEKKAKIRELKQKCEDLKHAAPEVKDEVTGRSDQKQYDDDEDTDDEKERINESAKMKQKHKKMMPAIIDEEDLDEEDAPAVKRKAGNRRKRENTASIIPRTTSFPRPLRKEKSGSEESSTRRSSQKLADQSSDDVDNLMDLL